MMDRGACDRGRAGIARLLGWPAIALAHAAAAGDAFCGATRARGAFAGRAPSRVSPAAGARWS